MSKVIIAVCCPYCGSMEIGVKESVTGDSAWAYCAKCGLLGIKAPINDKMSDEDITDTAYSAWNEGIKNNR